jgi:general secretion pathway protein C
VEDQKKKVQDVFSVGEMIFGEAKLLSVSPDQIEIERYGQREVLAIDETPEKSSSSAEFKEGVAMISDTEYLVQEQELDKALENLPLLLTQARAVPYFKDGKSVGLRLFAVKPGSLFERIGLRNGDILKSINGNPLGDLSQAIKLFETLKQEKSIGINMERDRNEKEVKYQIR